MSDKRRIQKRTQVSITGKVYDKLKAYAAEHNMAISTVVEQAVAPVLGTTPPEPRPARRYRGPRT